MTDESDNVTLLQRFFADWSRRDAALLATYLADDFVYQMIEGTPDIIGTAAFVDALGDVLGKFESVEMRIRRIVGYGHLVMAERMDSLIGKDAAHSMRFEVVCTCVIANGKLASLRDYPIPGGVFELGETFR